MTPTDAELDALETDLRAFAVAAGSIDHHESADMYDEAADAIKALRQQVLALQQEVTRQTALKNQAMRLNEENPCGG